MKVVFDGMEMEVVGAPNDPKYVSEYITKYIATVPPLGASFRISDEYLRDETPYFFVSLRDSPPIIMKPPYNIDYRSFWRKYSALRWKRETRCMMLMEEISVYYRPLDDDEYVYYDSGVRRVADTAFLFVDDITERDGVEVQSKLYNFLVPFDVFKAWLDVEKSCTNISQNAVARRMPAPLKGYLILYLNDKYQTIDLIRSITPDVSDDSSRLDDCFVEVEPHVFNSLLDVLKRADATTAFVEILKTAIKHAQRLPSISRLLNH
jgi:hypothetical protein